MLKKLCKCGEVGFITDVLGNPFPDNPHPCYTAFLMLVWYRKLMADLTACRFDEIFFEENAQEIRPAGR